MEYVIVIFALVGLAAAWWLRNTGYGGRKATKAVIHRSFAQVELEELTPELRESTLDVLRREGIEAAVDHLREEASIPKSQAEHVLILLARSELRRGQMFDDAKYPDGPPSAVTSSPPAAAGGWGTGQPRRESPAPSTPPPTAGHWGAEQVRNEPPAPSVNPTSGGSWGTEPPRSEPPPAPSSSPVTGGLEPPRSEPPSAPTPPWGPAQPRNEPPSPPQNHE